MIAVNRRHVLALLVLALLAVLLLPALDLPNTHLFVTAEDASHGPIFGLVALAALAFLRTGPSAARFRGRRRGYLAAWVIATTLGGLGELAQLPGPRDASWGDFINDGLGAASALLAFACVDPALRPLAPGRRRRYAAASLALAIVFLAPLAWVSAAYVQRRVQLPVLFDPASRLDRVFLFIQDTTAEYVALPDGRVAIDVALPPNVAYPGIHLSEPWPDWRGRAALVFDVENTGNEVVGFNLAIRDVRHDWEFTDRFNHHYDLAPRTRTTIRIPMSDIEHAPRSRLMDLAHMNGVVMFGLRSDRRGAFRLHAIRLE